MILVICLLFVWFSILIFAVLPNKLSVITNVLLYMLLAIVDINKLTILSDTLGLFQLSKKVPEFLSVILHRDFTFSITLLTFANVYLTTLKRSIKIGISLYTFTFLLCTGQFLSLNGAITYVKWNIFYECLLIVSLMIFTYWAGRLFIHLKQKERSL
ncbi:FlaA1/EpsC-like NDP-sugar epimerase [Paenibacillus sp. V4I3]|uniref:hypothetical protein n=1 Tax=unclassified Paenibacillus TaxID=185978 RepID=UPI00278A9E89|nr:MULTISPECIES: hypothetical protein [unclassified Paenibacillus]MDQ0872556.1 FlaA1/EpsC-like NDP-sugar epimerase [Paenibacillus sp. V4I3]MDQ0891559.1 FlaA1/EpsC-like NDP-sugar epimerase [Paenibacillus sp. V4I9]